MLCYIKYSSHLLYAVRSPGTAISTESMCRKGRLKMRSDDSNLRALLESKSSADPDGAEESFSLTNQVVNDICFNLIKQYKKSMDLEDVEGSQYVMLPDFATSSDEPVSHKSDKKPTVKMSAPVFSKPRRKLALKIQQLENDSLMVNPDCCVRILIDYIQETLEIEKNIQLDLCDCDGNLLKLHELKPYENARCRLKEKNVYYLTNVHYDSDSDRYLAIYPLINGNTTEEINIISKFRALGYKLSDSEPSILMKRNTRPSPRMRTQRKHISSAI